MQIENAHDRQLETLRVYGRLVGERDEWGGGLVLCCGEGCAASGTPTAVSIAGGTTLVLDGDAAVKSAMRRGELDFVVNSLDEALRALKNEVRLRRPLSVGLIADVDAVLREMVERGVLPDRLMIGANQNAQAIAQNESIRALQSAGMRLRSMVNADGERSDTGIADKRFKEVYLPVANAVELRGLDEKVLEILPPEDLIRRRWMQRVAKYLREARSGGRWVWLTEEERQRICG
jgi:urocanate hydratase